MARKDYSDLAYPEPWQVLGVSLLPFSIGHYLKLKRLDCAFVAEDSRPASIGDLILGVIVCSMESNPDSKHDPFWIWFNRKQPDGFWNRLAWWSLSKQATPAEWDVFRFGRKVGMFDFKAKAEEFQKYLDAHTRSPDYFILKEESANKTGAHWVHAMLANITSKCGYTMEQAYNLPFGQCLTDWLRLAEENGIIRFQTAEECAFLEGNA